MMSRTRLRTIGWWLGFLLCAFYGAYALSMGVKKRCRFWTWSMTRRTEHHRLFSSFTRSPVASRSFSVRSSSTRTCEGGGLRSIASSGRVVRGRDRDRQRGCALGCGGAGRERCRKERLRRGCNRVVHVNRDCVPPHSSAQGQLAQGVDDP